MDPKSSSTDRSSAGCIAFAILIGFLATTGGTGILMFGGLFTLVGISLLWNKRRDPFTGIGMVVFGALLLARGLLQN